MRNPTPVLALLFLLWAPAAALPEERALLLGATTTLQDSGILEDLVSAFKQETSIEVKPVVAGSGAVLRMGAEGNVDVLLTHAPSAEKELLASGALVSREEVMDNYFAIAGPPSDPEQIGKLETIERVYSELKARRASYVSRADDSGTHKSEVELMRAAGIDPKKGWYGIARTGSGMGQSLLVAGDRDAYILTDVPTHLAFRAQTGLKILWQKPDEKLRNVYSVLRVNPKKHPGKIQEEAARRFEQFLLSPSAQERIAHFGEERFGRPVFRALRLPSPDA